jgi:small subunit ribosomal protein S6
MRKYELMVILLPDVETSKVKDNVKSYLSVVEKNGGKIINIDVWGRKKFAYKIQKHTEGVYVVVDFELSDNSVPKELSRQLKINDTVLRYKLIRKE